MMFWPTIAGIFPPPSLIAREDTRGAVSDFLFFLVWLLWFLLKIGLSHLPLGCCAFFFFPPLPGHSPLPYDGIGVAPIILHAFPPFSFFVDCFPRLVLFWPLGPHTSPHETPFRSHPLARCLVPVLPAQRFPFFLYQPGVLPPISPTIFLSLKLSFFFFSRFPASVSPSPDSRPFTVFNLSCLKMPLHSFYSFLCSKCLPRSPLLGPFFQYFPSLPPFSFPCRPSGGAELPS